jgi:hypothetical protein
VRRAECVPLRHVRTAYPRDLPAAGAAAQPENSVIVDESVTSGFGYNQASTASLTRTYLVPHLGGRSVSFISVVGCGTLPSSGIRQNRRHETESLTPAHRLS